MEYLGKNAIHMAALGVARAALAIDLIFLGAGNAFSQSQAVYVTGWENDTEAIVNVNNSFIDVRPYGNSIFNVRLDLGNGGTASEAADLAGWLEGYANDLHRMSAIVDRLNSVLTNMSANSRTFSHIESYTQLTSENSTNLPAIKNALYYNDGAGNSESVAEILADIRDNGLSSGGSDFGVAFTNLAYMLSMQAKPAWTNYVVFAEDLANDNGMPLKYGLNSLYYYLIFGGLPLDAFNGDPKYPTYRPVINFRTHQRNFLNAVTTDAFASNFLERASQRKYDAYNTYQSYSALSNLFYNANIVTWTNQQAAGISPHNFALQWFDSYNTKFQNMLLQFGTYYAITNEDITPPAFAKNWYDSYNTRGMTVTANYFTQNDTVQGTNSIESLSQELYDVDTSYLPDWGVKTNNFDSIDTADMQPVAPEGYTDLGNSIKDKDWEYDRVDDLYDFADDKLMDKIDQLSADIEGLLTYEYGTSLKIPSFKVGAAGGGSSAASASPNSSVITVDEFYIDFDLPQQGKDKISDYWDLIIGTLKMSVAAWGFFHLWALICYKDIKQQSSPTLLD